MESAGYADGAQPRRIKELMAVGISTVVDCESCMDSKLQPCPGLLTRYGAARCEDDP